MPDPAETAIAQARAFLLMVRVGDTIDQLEDQTIWEGLARGAAQKAGGEFTPGTRQ